MPGFTRSQHGKYRPIVEAAWQRHAAAENIDPKSASERRSWYEGQLLAATGFSSTTALDAGRDFDAAIAHFEALADNGETYWQQRVETSDLRRILYDVFPDQRGKKIDDEAYQIDGVQITARYCEEIAAQMLSLESPKPLRMLSKDILIAVKRRLIIHRKRHEHRSSNC